MQFHVYEVLLSLFCFGPVLFYDDLHESTRVQCKNYQYSQHEIIHHAATPLPAQWHFGCGTHC